MSTQRSEQAYGCAYHEIEDFTKLIRPDQQGNFVIASRLLSRSPERLRASRFSAVDEVRFVRQAVLRAFQNRDAGADDVPGSVRGCLVQVLASGTDFGWGVVITEDEYCAKRRYQIVVPILDQVVTGEDGPETLEPTLWDVECSRQPWWAALPLEQPMFDTAAVVSLTERWQVGRDRRRWLKQQIAVLPTAVDAETLAAVTGKIVDRLRR